jgi:hypothetical protein
MDDIELIPQTPEQRQASILAFSAILGGGILAYQAGSAIRAGDLLGTDPMPAGVKPEASFITMTAGLGMLGYMLKLAVDDVGWKPIVLGSAGIFGFAVLARTIRGD